MAKESGLSWTAFNVDDEGGTPRDIRNDMTNMEFSTPYNNQDVTGIDKSAIERLALLADFSCTANGVFNPSANRAHIVLSGDLRIARTIGITVSAQVLNNECLITDYALTRAQGGEFTWQAPMSLSDGTVPNWT